MKLNYSPTGVPGVASCSLVHFPAMTASPNHRRDLQDGGQP